ncbi:MAG: hypothetical protein U0804_01395 [Gemmataceae bacterium]
MQNTLALLRAIRARVAQTDDAALYPVLVFDAALRQLFGLAIQPKRNKVLHPTHARYLGSWVADWAGALHPDLFG